MAQNIKLIHRTKYRLRYSSSYLRGEYNTQSLINYFESVKGIDKVRINKKIGSIVFIHDGSAKETIEEL